MLHKLHPYSVMCYKCIDVFVRDSSFKLVSVTREKALCLEGQGHFWNIPL